MEKDPVCGMMVDPMSAAGKSEYKGKTYYFCSTGCKKEFDKDPEKFLKSDVTGHIPHQQDEHEREYFQKHPVLEFL